MSNPAAKDEAERLTKFEVIFTYFVLTPFFIAYLLIWTTIGLGLCIAMLVELAAFGVIGVISILFHGSVPTRHFDVMMRAALVWPRGIRTLWAEYLDIQNKRLAADTKHLRGWAILFRTFVYTIVLLLLLYIAFPLKYYGGYLAVLDWLIAHGVIVHIQHILSPGG